MLPNIAPVPLARPFTRCKHTFTKNYCKTTKLPTYLHCSSTT